MKSKLKRNLWPGPLAHCGLPLASPDDEEVTIGEISGEPMGGFAGNRMLFTALVPLEEVGSLLKTMGGIGHGVTLSAASSGRGNTQASQMFSIQGPGGKRFETLVHTWRNHNKTVLLPDSALLAQYGLVPRVLKDGNISWDALDGPTYDVVRVMPVSTFSAPSEHTTSRVVIRRDYLEDYLKMKGCAAVSTFWDERFSLNDPEVAKLVGETGSKFEQPGREMWFMPMKLETANQVSQVWGCALLLKPRRRAIGDPVEPALKWPGRRKAIRGTGTAGVFSSMESAYVRDEALTKFENHGEFDISPEDGFVSYDGRWSVSHCRRISRNCIELELRKLYEGAPFEVIKHYNKFAVPEAFATKDAKANGKRHVGLRARDLVQGFLELTTTLTALCDAVGLSFTQEEVGSLSSKEIAYGGWWTCESLRSLGQVIPMTATFPDFLGRCTELFKVLENLRPAALRQVLIHLGLKREDISQFGGLKLLGTIGQLAQICRETGLDLILDKQQVAAKWDTNLKLAPLEGLFALNVFRTSDAHKPSSASGKVVGALERFKIDESACHAGWGKALDQVYDQTSESLREVNRLIVDSWN